MSSEAPPHRGPALRGAIGAGLLLVGLVCLALWRVFSGTENLPFTEGAGTPPRAHVTEGDTYSLAVPGGARAMIAHGVYGPPGGTLQLTCEWSTGGSLSQTLNVTAESSDAKAETTVARFTAPTTGYIRVTCANWGAVFIPDADNASADISGWFLVAAVITLTIGVGLALSAAREASLRQSAWSGNDEEVEGPVDLRDTAWYDGEVVDPNTRDVPP